MWSTLSWISKGETRNHRKILRKEVTSSRGCWLLLREASINILLNHKYHHDFWVSSQANQLVSLQLTNSIPIKTTNQLRDRLLISLLLLSELINFYPPWNHQKTTSFLIISGGNRSCTICLNSLNIRSKTWRQYYKLNFQWFLSNPRYNQNEIWLDINANYHKHFQLVFRLATSSRPFHELDKIEIKCF